MWTWLICLIYILGRIVHKSLTKMRNVIIL
uniref:Uncharacterized protein n=1 Tax=Anguilla anguilla TaxID=7936 RepID=A0A0E9SP85_ANGAN